MMLPHGDGKICKSWWCRERPSPLRPPPCVPWEIPNWYGIIPEPLPPYAPDVVVERIVIERLGRPHLRGWRFWGSSWSWEGVGLPPNATDALPRWNVTYSGPTSTSCSGPGGSCSGWTISDSCLMDFRELSDCLRHGSHILQSYHRARPARPRSIIQQLPCSYLRFEPFHRPQGTPNFSETRLSVMPDSTAARSHPATIWRFRYLSVTNHEWAVSCCPPLCCWISKGHAWGYSLPGNQPQGA